MTAARLRDLRTLDQVAQACGISAERIREYANATPQADNYIRLQIPKRSPKRRGAFRTVYKARGDALSGLHRSVSMVVVNSVPFDEHVQGFIKKRSTFSNARRHLGAKLLLHADIKGFFDAISTKQVRDALTIAGCVPDVAAVLASACTIDGYLRQGTRCAPSLANLVCQNLDFDLIALARVTNSTYSRYADDITFSGDEIPNAQAVQDILGKYGFELRDGRCYKQQRGRSQYVTGLTVTDKDRPRLPRRLKRRLRLVFYHIEKHGFSAHIERHGLNETELSYLEGMLRYVKSIEPDLARKWRQALAAGYTDVSDSESEPRG
jgi:hypothetical protein